MSRINTGRILTSRILTHKGYSIVKASLDEKTTKEAIEQLTVAPKVNIRYAGKDGAPSFKLYKESPLRWYFPRAWAIEKFGPPDSEVLSEGTSLSSTAAEFKGTPYQYQTDIIEKFVNAGANGLICVPCGKGKTFMALRIASLLQKRFLIVVDKEFLMNQWKGEITALMPNLRVGILQSDTHQIGTETITEKALGLTELKALAKQAGLRVGGTKDELTARLKEANVDYTPKSETVQYDCTICMIQTLCLQTFADGTFNDYGFTIFDECHHLGAQHFSKTLQKIQTKKMLGLSATPTREDGLSKVFHWFLGPPIHWEKTREPDPQVEVQAVFIKSNDLVYNTIPTNWRGEPVMGTLLTNVLGCEERNQEIAKRLLEFCKEPLRKILVLSERIGHLQMIESLITAAAPAIIISYYIGGMKEVEREEGAAAAQVLLASYAMASEAMNIKTLNTVILASPRKNVEQSTGRILRVRPDQRQVHPIIVDIVDVHRMYRSQWKKRSIYYKKCTYNVTGMPKNTIGDTHVEVEVEVDADSDSDSETKTKAKTKANGCLFIE